MPGTLVAPESETFPNRKRWTVAECERLIENGELVGRYELIEGEILSKMGQNAPHRIALILMRTWLVAIFGSLFVQTEAPVTIPGEDGKTTEPEPDIAVTRETTTTYFPDNPGPSNVRLIVEISDTTLNFDLNIKALLYARIGIPEYWVMDVVNRCLHRHLQPTHNGYGEITSVGENDSITLLDRPETIRVGELLPPVAEES